MINDNKPKTFTSELFGGGKVTVPIELRKIWGIGDGDSVEFEIKNVSKAGSS